MAGYIIGFCILAFAVWRVYTHRAPGGSIAFDGLIVDEVSRESRKSGRKNLLYAPRVAFRHPTTGHDGVYEPTRFGQHRFTVGSRTPLVYDPATDRVFRPLDRPIRETLVLVALGVFFIVAQFLARG